MIKPPKRIVRISYLIQATGLSRGACYREMENNPEFPKKIKLGTRAISFARLLRELDLDVNVPAERSRPPALISNRFSHA